MAKADPNQFVGNSKPMKIGARSSTFAQQLIRSRELRELDIFVNHGGIMILGTIAHGYILFGILFSGNSGHCKLYLYPTSHAETEFTFRSLG